MVYALQIQVNGDWRTTSTTKTEVAAEGRVAGVANAYGCRVRVKAFASEADAWK